MHLSKVALSALAFLAASSAAPATQTEHAVRSNVGLIHSSYLVAANAVYAGLTKLSLLSEVPQAPQASGLFLRLTVNSTKGYYYAVEEDVCYGMINLWGFLAERNLPVAALKTIKVVGREAKAASLIGFTENDCTGSEGDNSEYPTWGSFEIVKS